MNFNTQQVATIVFIYLFALQKVTKYKVVYPFKIYKFINKIAWSHSVPCKFCLHLGSLNVRPFVKVESTGLKSMGSR
jgi:hypothetical protein